MKKKNGIKKMIFKSNGQGLYLNEHRDAGGPRRVVITLQGLARRRPGGA